jgi:metal-sulfur cluster biosynthetic enzyme
MAEMSVGPGQITEEQVLAALKECYDPEIPVNIVDLGLVYGVTIIDDWVGVKMTLTTPGCGMADMITNKVRERIKLIPGVSDGDVRLVWQPAWHQGLMSESAKKQLRIGAPPAS